LGGDARAVQK